MMIPQDVVLGTTIITINGNNDALIENYKGLLEYTSEIIRDCSGFKAIYGLK